MCVQCVASDDCSDAAPVCDLTTNTCRGCVADGDCASSVCDSSNGTCVDESKIFYASPTGGDGNACSHTDPCSIAHAIASVDSTRTTVRMLPGNYTTNVTITGKALWLDGNNATLTASTTGNGIEVNDGAHVKVTGLDVVDLNTDVTNENAIRCEVIASGAATPVLELDGISIDAAKVSLFAAPCTVNATGSTFHVRATGLASVAAFAGGADGTSAITIDRCVLDGGNGVLSYSSSTISVTNSLIENMTGSNGGLLGSSFFTDPQAPPGILIASFVTLVNAPLICGNGVPVCLGGSAAGVCIDDSIITAAAGNAVTGTACAVNYSIAFPQSAALTGGHDQQNVDPRFLDAANDKFELSASSPAIDAADPAATDTIDLLGTARPQGLRDDLGAYEYKP
jgi:hypothetical protein